MTKEVTPRPLAKYDFTPEVLDIIISGKSSIDSLTAFQIHDLDEADRFIRSYGYDLDKPVEKAEMLGNFHEALSFIRKHFLQPENPSGLKLEIPRKILELTDVRDLLLMVSSKYPGQTADSQGQLLQRWACSIVKVMHTVSHIDKDVRTPYFPDVQTQILDRFYKFIHRDTDGHLLLGDKPNDPLRIDLASFETKPKKSRESTIIKLLHKPENVAEDIFDQVGIRFVTHTVLDSIRVIKFIKDKMIIMPPNIKPSRSRNTLFEVEPFKKKLKELLSLAEKNAIDESDLRSQLEESIRPSATKKDNPHTSEFYRAIQFTCRQLIKLKNPLYEDLKELKKQLKGKTIHEDLQKLVERLDLKHLPKEVRFFYPFEIQVTDKQSAEENEKGQSAHSEYKKAQIQTALKRVMGNLVDVVRQ